MTDGYVKFKELCEKFAASQPTVDWQQVKLIPKNKKGTKIYIKKKNRGKFTESAKRAHKSVQEHARDVLNDPNATTLQKKRANFAINAAKWNKK